MNMGEGRVGMMTPATFGVFAAKVIQNVDQHAGKTYTRRVPS